MKRARHSHIKTLVLVRGTFSMRSRTASKAEERLLRVQHTTVHSA